MKVKGDGKAYLVKLYVLDGFRKTSFYVFYNIGCLKYCKKSMDRCRSKLIIILDSYLLS